MKKITIVDYGCGNILNLIRAIKFLGFDAEATNDKHKIINSSNLILPGVGAFGNAIEKLEKNNLKNSIIEYARLNKPLFGICLGMQLLFTTSFEFGRHKGLNLIEGEVIKISNKKNKEIKIPHVGWNQIYPIKKDNKEWNNEILKDISIGNSFYFVHSFVGVTKEVNSTIATCNYYGITIPAVVSINNIYGCQFHPEKSGDSGLYILKNFCTI
mgnify:CR=1 FL=1